MTISAGSRFGPYEIVAPLGAGGMGDVYRARDPRLSREVALKILPGEVVSDASRLKRFEKEARAASALNHPNIVTIYDIGSTDSVSWIAMERVEGKTLREVLFGGAPSVKRLLQIALQVADGLARAHEAGIVHRDLKPENVMVTKDGLVKILDFGLAKQTGPVSGSDEGSRLPTETGTSPGVVLGTVGYMSPEQASGEKVDFRSDQFSFGSILYEAATGRRAFSRKTAAETMSAIIREEPEPMGKVRPDVPAPLRWIVGRCLAKDPQERYVSTRDLARDLAYLRDHVSEISGPEAAVAFPAKRKRILLPLLVAAGVLVVGVGGWAIVRNLLSQAPSASAPVLRRLTFRSGTIQNARLAPDAQTIVYGATWQADLPRLYHTRLGSPESSPFDFGANGADILAISPSGEMAILQDQGFGIFGVLSRVPMAGGTPRQVLEDVFYGGADWDPGGKELVVAHQVGNTTKLEYPIGRVIYGNDLWSPRFSPGGDSIAFFEYVGTAGSPGWAVSIIDPSGKSRRVLSSGWAPPWGGAPCWRPDGKEIWFSASKGDGKPQAIYGVTLAGTVRLLFRVPGHLELFDVSRDGRVLAAHHNFVHVVRGRIFPDEKERELSWLDGSEPADLSDDGKTLVLTETREGSGGTPTVYLRPTDGSPATKLGEGNAVALSPDGKWVLATSGRERLVLLPTGAGQVKSLPAGQFASYGGASWFPDGKRFVFSAVDAAGRSRIYLQRIEGGDPRPISPVGFSMHDVVKHVLSPDGKWVVGTKGTPGVDRTWWLLPTDGGEPRPVAGLTGIRGEVILRWSEDGRSLIVRTGTPGEIHRPFSDTPIRISILDPESGKKRLSSEIRSSEPIAMQLLLSADLKSYVFGSTRTYSELYLIEGLR